MRTAERMQTVSGRAQTRVAIVLSQIALFIVLSVMAMSGHSAATDSTQFEPKTITGMPLRCDPPPRASDQQITVQRCNNDKYYLVTQAGIGGADFGNEISAGEYHVRVALLLTHPRVTGWAWDMDVDTPAVAEYLGMTYEDLQKYLQLDTAGVASWGSSETP